jgi:tetratricopeptide (TPR) repeat protein
MNPIETSTMTEPSFETVGDELDRLEIPAGKIGMITPEQGFGLLHGLDAVYSRMQDLEPGGASIKMAQAQFDGITSRMQKEAGQFIRDLGGAQALQRARAEVKPPKEHSWWYLDEWLTNQHKAAFQRLLVIAGIVVVAFIVLALVYNRFLAPDPSVTARYGHEQTARDLMMKGDLQGALDEVTQGLEIPPVDPSLQVLKGVILEKMGQSSQAGTFYTQAKIGFNNPDEFYLARGQDYIQVGLADQAMADAQSAVQANPQSGSAYLLLGQIYEVQRKNQEALDAYNKAYEAADQSKQPELAALARMRLAMLMQSMNSQFPLDQTGTPAP